MDPNSSSRAWGLPSPFLCTLNRMAPFPVPSVPCIPGLPCIPFVSINHSQESPWCASRVWVSLHLRCLLIETGLYMFSALAVQWGGNLWTLGIGLPFFDMVSEKERMGVGVPDQDFDHVRKSPQRLGTWRVIPVSGMPHILCTSNEISHYMYGNPNKKNPYKLCPDKRGT